MQRTQPGAARPASERPGFRVRPASGTDRAAIRAFLDGLSLRTRYLRFFTGAAPTSAAMLAVLTGARGNADALVATEASTVIGHAMAVDSAAAAGARTAEIGVVVADSRQGLGVGSALVRRLAEQAWARGAASLTMEVLRENQDVLAMIAGHWPDARYHHCGEHVTICARLPVPGRQRRAGVLSPGGWPGRPGPRVPVLPVISPAAATATGSATPACSAS